MMRRGLILLIIFVALLVAPSVYRYLSYYGLGGAGDRGEIPTYDPAAVVSAEPTPPAAPFVDEPTMGEGDVLLDMAHENAFTLDELGVLSGRLAARGYDLIPYDGGNLAAALRAVNAFVVVTPIREFTSEEIQAVKAFIERGGRLLLVGDPTRFEVVVEEDLFEISFFIEDDQIPLNSLAEEFDITFNGDYLYNQVENEGNFRNILLHDSALAESDLTADVEQLAFYGAHSLDVGPGATAVLRGDDNTWSSATDRPGGLTLAASSEDEHVLALSDLHFMMEPYHTSYDNGRFVSHIADFLTMADGRAYTLADFPYFYSQPVNLVYTGQPDLGPRAFDQAIALQDAFDAVDQELDLAATADADQDTLYLGLYNQAGDDVLEILASNGITFTIEPPVLTAEEVALTEKEEVTETEESEEGEDSEATEDEVSETEDAESEEQEPETTRLLHTPLGNVQMSGTALLLLDESSGQRQVIVLAASNEGLDNTVNLLLEVIPLDADYETAGCVVQDNLALCPTNVSDEEVETELLSGGLPEEEPTEEGEESGEEPTEEQEEPGDATNQGTIALDETVEGELGTEERHSWTFNSGSAVINILVQGDENMDTVLELYDPNNNLITTADSTFTGEAEEILSAEIDDNGDWTIVVHDYYDDGGSYTLTVTDTGEQPDDSGDDEGDSGAIENVFLFVDDDGEAVGDGFTSADALSTLLSDSYDVTMWVSTVDGPLGEDTLANADLLIWDSGDYRNENGFLDEDTAVIFQYMDDGGMLFVTGSSPTILADVDLAPLSDVEITGDDEILLDGLVSGEVITLEGTYETAVSDLLEIEGDEGSTAFFLRGPDSDSAGEIVGVATIDSFTEQRSLLLLLPFAVLPNDIQETLLNNIMAWFTGGTGG